MDANSIELKNAIRKIEQAQILLVEAQAAFASGHGRATLAQYSALAHCAELSLSSALKDLEDAAKKENQQ